MEQLITQYRAGSDKTQPLVFLVHGRAGTLSVMSIFERSIPDTWHRVFVQAPHADPIGGFSWWDIQSDDTVRSEQRERSRVALAALIEGYAAQQGLTPQFSVAIGFSQGAAMLSLIMQEEVLGLRGVALLSGFVLESSSNRQPKSPSVFVFHGTRDDIIPLSRAERGIDFLRERGYSVTKVLEDVGHKVGIQGMKSLGTWLKNELTNEQL
jgi:predicted esterase